MFRVLLVQDWWEDRWRSGSWKKRKKENFYSFVLASVDRVIWYLLQQVGLASICGIRRDALKLARAPCFFFKKKQKCKRIMNETLNYTNFGDLHALQRLCGTPKMATQAKKGVLVLFKVRTTIGTTITPNPVKSHRNYRGVMVKLISNSGSPCLTLG